MSNLNLTDVGAERAVLAGLFCYGLESYVEVSDLLDHASFGNHNNQIIYKCLQRIFENQESADLPSLLSAAEQLNFSDSINTCLLYTSPSPRDRG